MTIDKSMKTSISASIIASIIFILFIQPLFNWIWEIISSTSNSIYTLWVNRIIERTAQNNISLIPTFIFLILVQGMFMYFVYSGTILTIEYRRKRKINLKQAEKLNIEQEIIVTKNNDNASTLVKVLHKLIYFFWFFIFFTYTFFISIYFEENTSVRLSNTFNQRMNVVAPYTTEQQYKILISKWALMKNKYDYIIIMDTIGSIAKKNKIELPEPMIEMKIK